MRAGGQNVLQTGTKKVLKRLAWAGLALLALVGVFTFDFLRHGGQFRDLPAATPLACDTVTLGVSAEDIQFDRARGIAFLSAFDRRALIEGRASEGDVLQLELPTTIDAAPAAPSTALVAKPA
jgi:hypothetical protein